MHHAMVELPLVDDYGDGFQSRLVEWGGMIVSYETFPKGVDATPLFKGLPNDRTSTWRVTGVHPKGPEADGPPRLYAGPG